MWLVTTEGTENTENTEIEFYRLNTPLADALGNWVKAGATAACKNDSFHKFTLFIVDDSMSLSYNDKNHKNTLRMGWLREPWSFVRPCIIENQFSDAILNNLRYFMVAHSQSKNKGGARNVESSFLHECAEILCHE